MLHERKHTFSSLQAVLDKWTQLGLEFQSLCNGIVKWVTMWLEPFTIIFTVVIKQMRLLLWYCLSEDSGEDHKWLHVSRLWWPAEGGGATVITLRKIVSHVFQCYHKLCSVIKWIVISQELSVLYLQIFAQWSAWNSWFWVPTKHLFELKIMYLPIHSKFFKQNSDFENKDNLREF